MRAWRYRNMAALIAFLCAFFASVHGLAQEAAVGAEQQDEAAGLPIARVDVTGLSRVSEQKVRNTIRTQAGDPYDPQTVLADLRNLERLGDFKTVTPTRAIQPDNTVVVTFHLEEQPLLADVQVVGNRLISDQEILGAIPIRAGVPADEYLIQVSIRRIRDLYRERGHYKAEVAVDQKTLDESNILIFQVIEGPRVRIREIDFEFVDTQSFSPGQLKAQIQTETAFFILRKGKLDPDVIEQDIAALDRFYKNRGYLDVRVDRRLELSPDDREAKVVFVIDEGPVYTMRNVTAMSARPDRPLRVFSDQEIAALLAIKSGDVYSQDKIRRSVEILKNAYGEMGYIDSSGKVGDAKVDVQAVELRVGEQPEVDLRLFIDEGERAYVGEVNVSGNFLTKSNVIQRELRFQPGRPISLLDIEESERRLRRLRLFSTDPEGVDITIQEPDRLEPQYRDILVEVKETNTGSFNFGAGVGSDQGVFGDISLNQRNFDIADWPESVEEFFRGRAFRGAGQQFTLQLQPGNEVSRYSVSVTEPYLLDLPVSLTTSAFFRDWQFRVYDEERINGTIGLSRRLGDVWSVGVSGRFEQVELTDIAPFAPTEVFDARGPDVLTGLGVRLVRNTTGTFIRPGRGSVLELSLEQVGALGGDFDFTTISSDYTLFLTIDEDFLGRRSILRLNTRAAYIFNGDDAPVYEQFYLGGRSFRGFDFRTISPKGIRADNGRPSDEPVGGEWLFFAGAQYEFPIFEELFNGVVFMDSGTVSDDVGFDEYRVSAGFGIRLYIEALGPLPLSFDFGFPIVKEPGDETQFFSFFVDIPF